MRKLVILFCLLSPGAWAAISTPINCALGTPASSGTSIVTAAMGTVASTCATAASTTTGNHLTAYISYQVVSGGSLTTGCTDTAGDTFHLVSGTVFGVVVIDMAYADNITARAGNVVTCSLSGSGSTRFLYVEEVSGVALTSSFDISAVNGGTGTSLTKAIVTTLSGDIICAIVSGGSSLGTLTAGTGFTKGRAGAQITTEYEIVGAAASYPAAISWTTSSVNTAFMAFAFKSASGAANTRIRHSVRAGN